MKRSHFIALLFICLTAASDVLGAGKETLVDVTGVAVIIDKIPENAQKDGLNAEEIKALILSRLDKANIMLLEDRQWFSVFGGAYLLVKVIASKSEAGQYYVMFLEIELYQTVVLFGKKLGRNITTAATTWSAGKLLSCGVPVLKECVETNLSELTDMFIKDYLEVNSGKPSEKP